MGCTKHALGALNALVLCLLAYLVLLFAVNFSSPCLILAEAEIYSTYTPKKKTNQEISSYLPKILKSLLNNALTSLF